MPSAQVRFALTLDQAAFARGLRRAAEASEDFSRAMRKVGQALNDMARAWQPIFRSVRECVGRGNTTPEGLWQSDMCAAWLHGSCPHPDLTQCDCTCHGGTLR